MSSTDIPKYDHPQKSLIRSSIDKEDNPIEVEAKPLEFKSQPKKRELTFKEKIKQSFVKEDLKDLGEYLLFDLVIPGIQRGAWEMIVGTTSKALGIPMPSNWNRPIGFNGSYGYSGKDSRGYTPYNQSNPRSSAQAQYNDFSRRSRIRRDIYSTNTITWDFREDADIMLQRLLGAARTHPFISVHTFYSLAQVHDGNEYTNASYGWSSQVILAEADIDNDGYGYFICLPAPREIPTNGRY